MSDSYIILQLLLVLLWKRKQGVSELSRGRVLLIEVNRQSPEEQESEEVPSRESKIDPSQHEIERVHVVPAIRELSVLLLLRPLYPRIEGPGRARAEEPVGLECDGNEDLRNIVESGRGWFRDGLADHLENGRSCRGRDVRRPGEDQDERHQEAHDLGDAEIDQERSFGNELSLSEAVFSHRLERDVVLLQPGQVEFVGIEADGVGDEEVSKKSDWEDQIRLGHRVSITQNQEV